MTRPGSPNDRLRRARVGARCTATNLSILPPSNACCSGGVAVVLVAGQRLGAGSAASGCTGSGCSSAAPGRSRPLTVLGVPGSRRERGRRRCSPRTGTCRSSGRTTRSRRRCTTTCLIGVAVGAPTLVAGRGGPGRRGAAPQYDLRRPVPPTPPRVPLVAAAPVSRVVRTSSPHASRRAAVCWALRPCALVSLDVHLAYMIVPQGRASDNAPGGPRRPAGAGSDTTDAAPAAYAEAPSSRPVQASNAAAEVVGAVPDARAGRRSSRRRTGVM